MKLSIRIWILIIFLIFSFLFIFGLPPKFLDSGIVVKSIESNSSLFEQGLRIGERIESIDGIQVNTVEEYSSAISGKFNSGKDEKLEIITSKGDYLFYGNKLPDFSVSKIPFSNLKLGLDLAGGARALIKAKNKSLDSSELKDLVEITQNRLNAFGLTDLKVAPVSDLSGNNFMLIEIAGATPKDLKTLLGEQGKFEARIGNVTVFEGGKKDVASVARDAQNARIESCDQQQDGSYYCRFSFSITLSPDAAKRHAKITENLTINVTPQGNYLSKKLNLILDGRLMESLLIGEGLKGIVTTQISISGSGTGVSQEDAYNDAKVSMKKLQTILMTGSLPYKLEIIKLDTTSPTLGNEFINSIFLAGLVAILIVSIIVFIRYRSWKASIALVGITASEVFIILGIAALIQWNLDLPGIAGILATIGTGIDDLIVIMDETAGEAMLSLKKRLKRAFTIILGAYFTSLVSLLPLMWAGAGLLKGFAITTIIGISVGVFVTRPAFGDLLKRFKK